MPSTTKEKIYLGEAEIEEFESENLVRLRLITHNARLVDSRKERGITLLRKGGLNGIFEMVH
jgi:hypothetical protein